jgi:hypothetical protein
MRVVSLDLVLLVTTASFAGVQEARQFGVSAWLARRVAIPAASVSNACAHLPHQAVYVDPPRSTTCRVIRYVPLDSTSDAIWSYALYHHTSVYHSAGSSQPDTIPELELVLLAAPLDSVDHLAAVAHTRADHNGIIDMSVAVADHPNGVLLGVEFCLNGTGGCWQEFLHRSGPQWRELPDPYGLLVPELRRMGVVVGPQGSRLAMPRINTRTLRGVISLYGPRDANCCPSRRAEFQLELTRQGFRLLELTVLPDSL